MKKSIMLVTALMLVMALLAGCGDKKPELNLYSWADNFDPELIKGFEKEFGVKVNYDIFSSNEEMLAKLQAGGAQYDLIQPSDYMVSTMIKLDLLEKLDKNNIPNSKYLMEKFQSPPYDPKSEHSVVYAWGVTGIGYNKQYVKETPTSWADLWNNKYKGHLVMLDDSREVLGMALKKNGHSLNTKDKGELATAKKDIEKLLPNLLAFDTNTIKQKFITEEAWIGTIWSGDAAFVLADNPNMGYVVPKEGAVIWADTFAVPKGAKNKELAEKFINYVMDPQRSAANYEKIGYSNPNVEAMKYHSKEYRENPMINLKEEDVNRTEWIVDVGATLKEYDRLWTELKSGN